MAHVALNGIRRRQIEAANVAVLRFGHPRLEVVSQTEVEREVRCHAPVVVDEEPVADDRVVLARSDLDSSAGGNAEQEGGDALTVLAGGGAGGARVGAVEIVGAAPEALVVFVLAQLPPVVAALEACGYPRSS